MERNTYSFPQGYPVEKEKWVQSAETCSTCHKTLNMFTTKGNCGCCGRICCASCLTAELSFGPNTKPFQVCLECFQMVQDHRRAQSAQRHDESLQLEMVPKSTDTINSEKTVLQTSIETLLEKSSQLRRENDELIQAHELDVRERETTNSVIKHLQEQNTDLRAAKDAAERRAQEVADALVGERDAFRSQKVAQSAETRRLEEALAEQKRIAQSSAGEMTAAQAEKDAELQRLRERVRALEASEAALGAAQQQWRDAEASHREAVAHAEEARREAAAENERLVAAVRALEQANAESRQQLDVMATEAQQHAKERSAAAEHVASLTRLQEQITDLRAAKDAAERRAQEVADALVGERDAFRSQKVAQSAETRRLEEALAEQKRIAQSSAGEMTAAQAEKDAELQRLRERVRALEASEAALGAAQQQWRDSEASHREAVAHAEEARREAAAENERLVAAVRALEQANAESRQQLDEANASIRLREKEEKQANETAAFLPCNRWNRRSIVRDTNFELPVVKVDVLPSVGSFFEWGYDIVEAKSHVFSVLQSAAVHVARSWSLFESEEELNAWSAYVALIESNYRDNYYHNATHAADVLQGLVSLVMLCGNLFSQMTRVEKIAVVLAAIVHDVKHPGRSQIFLKNVFDPIYLHYNGQSVLEQMHLATAFSLLAVPTADFTLNMSDDEALLLHSIVTSMVLKTDMAVHAACMEKVGSHTGAYPYVLENAADRLEVLSFLLHSADIGATTKGIEVALKWRGITEEMYAQGDDEKERGLPLSPGTDRSANLIRGQVFFIECFVFPTFDLLHQLFSGVSEPLVRLEQLLDYYHKETGGERKKLLSKSYVHKDEVTERTVAELQRECAALRSGNAQSVSAAQAEKDVELQRLRERVRALEASEAALGAAQQQWRDAEASHREAVAHAEEARREAAAENERLVAAVRALEQANAESRQQLDVMATEAQQHAKERSAAAEHVASLTRLQEQITDLRAAKDAAERRAQEVADALVGERDAFRSQKVAQSAETRRLEEALAEQKRIAQSSAGEMTAAQAEKDAELQRLRERVRALEASEAALGAAQQQWRDSEASHREAVAHAEEARREAAAENERLVAAVRALEQANAECRQQLDEANASIRLREKEEKQANETAAFLPCNRWNRRSIVRDTNFELPVVKVDVLPSVGSFFEWGYDIVEAKSHVFSVLQSAAVHVARSWSLFESEEELNAWSAYVALIESNYRDNYYHNATHAADVLQGLVSLVMLCGNLFSQMTRVEKIAVVLAAIVHDVKHPGRSQIFLKNVFDPIYLHYNGQSVLEQMHLATAFSLLAVPTADFTLNMSDDEALLLHSIVTSMVLKTDMAVHAACMEKVGSHTGAYPYVLENAADRLEVLSFLLHSADIGATTKGIEVALKWRGITEEMYAQGDDEKERGLPLSPGTDRSANLIRGQVFFIECFVFPTFDLLHQLFSGVSEPLVRLEQLLDYYHKETGGERKKLLSKSYVHKDEVTERTVAELQRECAALRSGNAQSVSAAQAEKDVELQRLRERVRALEASEAALGAAQQQWRDAEASHREAVAHAEEARREAAAENERLVAAVRALEQANAESRQQLDVMATEAQQHAKERSAAAEHVASLTRLQEQITDLRAAKDAAERRAQEVADALVGERDAFRSQKVAQSAETRRLEEALAEQKRIAQSSAGEMTAAQAEKDAELQRLRERVRALEASEAALGAAQQQWRDSEASHREAVAHAEEARREAAAENERLVAAVRALEQANAECRQQLDEANASIRLREKEEKQANETAAFLPCNRWNRRSIVRDTNFELPVVKVDVLPSVGSFFEWGYDIVEAKSHVFSVLQSAAVHVARSWSLFESEEELNAWSAYVALIESNYRDNYYHNATHAADVLQGLVSLVMLCGNLFSQMTRVEKIAVVLAAIVHDVKHPGRSQIFLKNVFDPIYLHYNGQSVLEQMHLATAFSLLAVPTADFTLNMSDDEALLLHSIVTSMVLKTDMAVHAACMEKVGSHTGAYPYVLENAADRLEVLSFLLHSADIGATTKGIEVALKWRGITEEMYAQGDDEKERGLPLSPGTDRSANLIRGQVFFIECFVFPTFDLLHQLFSGVSEPLVRLEQLLDYYHKETGGERKKLLSKSYVHKDEVTERTVAELQRECAALRSGNAQSVSAAQAEKDVELQRLRERVRALEASEAALGAAQQQWRDAEASHREAVAHAEEARREAAAENERLVAAVRALEQANAESRQQLDVMATEAQQHAKERSAAAEHVASLTRLQEQITDLRAAKDAAERRAQEVADALVGERDAFRSQKVAQSAETRRLEEALAEQKRIAQSSAGEMTAAQAEKDAELQRLRERVRALEASEAALGAAQQQWRDSEASHREAVAHAEEARREAAAENERLVAAVRALEQANAECRQQLDEANASIRLREKEEKQANETAAFLPCNRWNRRSIVRDTNFELPVVKVDVLPSVGSFFEWGYDIVEAKSHVFSVLQSAAVHVARSWSLFESEEELNAWSAYVALIESNYRDNYYHNATHAADVLQGLVSLVMLCGNLFSQMTRVEKIAVVLAAIVHDVKHPGRSQIFLKNVFDPIYLHYNGQSVLEQMHLATAFSLLAVPTADFTLNMSDDEALLLHSIVTSMVLKTDMAVHAACMEKVGSHTGAYPYVLENAADRLEVLSFLLHSADIGATTKGIEVALKWRGITEEMYAQGDDEKERGLPLSPGTDRSANLIRGQVFFIECFVFPTFDLLHQLFSGVSEPLVRLEQLLDYYHKETGGERKKLLSKSYVHKDEVTERTVAELQRECAALRSGNAQSVSAAQAEKDVELQRLRERVRALEASEAALGAAQQQWRDAEASHREAVAHAEEARREAAAENERLVAAVRALEQANAESRQQLDVMATEAQQHAKERSAAAEHVASLTRLQEQITDLRAAKDAAERRAQEVADALVGERDAFRSQKVAQSAETRRLEEALAEQKRIAQSSAGEMTAAQAEKDAELQRLRERVRALEASEAALGAAQQQWRDSEASHREAVAHAEEARREAAAENERLVAAVRALEQANAECRQQLDEANASIRLREKEEKQANETAAFLPCNRWNRRSIVRDTNFELPVVKVDVLPSVGSFFEWGYDIVEAKSHVFSVLQSAAVHVARSWSLFESEEELNAWSAYVALIESNYRDNYYHNATHAADVLQGLVSLVMLCGNLFSQMTRVEKIAVVLAAIVHDVKHPGRSQIFLKNVFDPIYLHYNGQSVLEQMHLATAFSLLAVPTADFTLNMSDDEALLLHSIVTSMVLKTDMAVHAACMEKVGSHTGAYPYVLENAADRLEVLSFLLHSADIGATTKGIEVALKWRGITEEMYAQGDDEKERGLPLSPGTDRSANLIRGQVFFIECFVFPTFDLLHQLFSGVSEPLVRLEQLLDYYHKETGGERKKLLSKSYVHKDEVTERTVAELQRECAALRSGNAQSVSAAQAEKDVELQRLRERVRALEASEAALGAAQQQWRDAEASHREAVAHAEEARREAAAENERLVAAVRALEQANAESRQQLDVMATEAQQHAKERSAAAEHVASLTRLQEQVTDLRAAKDAAERRAQEVADALVGERDAFRSQKVAQSAETRRLEEALAEQKRIAQSSAGEMTAAQAEKDAELQRLRERVRALEASEATLGAAQQQWRDAEASHREAVAHAEEARREAAAENERLVAAVRALEQANAESRQQLDVMATEAQQHAKERSAAAERGSAELSEQKKALEKAMTYIREKANALIIREQQLSEREERLQWQGTNGAYEEVLESIKQQVSDLEERESRIALYSENLADIANKMNYQKKHLSENRNSSQEKSATSFLSGPYVTLKEEKNLFPARGKSGELQIHLCSALEYLTRALNR